MENSVQNLLDRIGQSQFPYRDFNLHDINGLLTKWPLIARVSKPTDVQTAKIGEAKVNDRGSRQGFEPRTASTRAGDPGFLGNYDPSVVSPINERGADIRSLLGRLSEERP